MIFPIIFAIAANQAPTSAFLRYPDIHGDQIVFTNEGDLWLGNLKTGETHRLTTDAGTERFARFSPDGTQIVFMGEYDGTPQAYVMPTAGGTPKKLTSLEGIRGVNGWTPDGKNVVIRYFGVPTNYSYETVPAAGGVPTQMPLEFASHISFGATSDSYVFTRFDRWYMAWFRYIGGMQNQIWLRQAGASPEFKQITDIEGTNEYPTWCGGRVYFVNENQAHFTLMSIPAGGGKAKKEFDSDVEIREVQTDGKRLVFESGHELDVFDPATGKAQKVEVTLNSDLIHERPTTVRAEDFAQDVSLTPTGKRVLVEARGQIVTVPMGEGEARVLLAKPGVRYRHPAMSPDAKKIAYVDDSTGEEQVYVADADGSNPKQLTKDTKGQIWGVRFSPDSKWVSFTDSEMHIRIVNVETATDKIVATIPFTWFAAAYEFSPNSNWITFSLALDNVNQLSAIELYNIPTGKTYQVSDGRANDIAPAFSQDGKYLVFVTNRRIDTQADPILNQLNVQPMSIVCIAPLSADGENPLAPKDPEEGQKAEAEKKDDKKVDVKIDVDGLFDRRIELPIEPAQVTKVAMSGTRVLYATDAEVKFFDVNSKAGGDVAKSATFTLSDDGKTLLIPGKPNRTIGIDGEGKKTENYGNLRLSIDPPAEWKQIYWDAWRHMRDYFYVSNMHGVDWKAIGDEYATFLPSVRSRSDLDELIRWLQAGVGSSHEYLTPGDQQDIKPRVPNAYLGADLAADPSGCYKVTKILRGDGYTTSEMSPLLGAGKNIKEGMFLLAIGGEKLSLDADPLDKLAGRAGQTVSVTVNDKPTMEGAKTYFIKPVPSEHRMRYLEWVEANRQYVDKKSGGKLGYLHLAAMSNSDMNDFIRQYFYQRNKEGFIIDGRFNNGGFVQDYINRILNESLTGFFNMRNSPYSWTRQGDYFTGPMAALINEFDISCGEEFPHRFRSIKRGPLFGRRTMGGEVGSDPGWPLADGGKISVPNYGMWTPDGKWAIEGKGVSPDIDVPSDPNAFIKGSDPQIDKAIEYLLNEIKKNPPVKPHEPPAKDRVKNGGS
ncbi:MAG: hypothetical protein GC165_14570 [Armatimonadetes bacterium]|nr:hypothetical protein [Armatimonadota bacterium]